ncbi:MAG: hypothetical protein U9O97_04495 [Elusimicrobiota bacterium]|nr:hypothetical protein [Elusimicrobiota bacterium]
MICGKFTNLTENLTAAEAISYEVVMSRADKILDAMTAKLR